MQLFGIKKIMRKMQQHSLEVRYSGQSSSGIDLSCFREESIMKPALRGRRLNGLVLITQREAAERELNVHTHLVDVLTLEATKTKQESRKEQHIYS